MFRITKKIPSIFQKLIWMLCRVKWNHNHDIIAIKMTWPLLKPHILGRVIHADNVMSVGGNTYDAKDMYISMYISEKQNKFCSYESHV